MKQNKNVVRLTSAKPLSGKSYSVQGPYHITTSCSSVKYVNVAIRDLLAVETKSYFCFNGWYI